MNHITEVGEAAIIAPLIERARAAMAVIANYDQSRTDELVQALAWSIYEQGRAEELAALAVRDTGLGNISDKITKNQRKTFGTLRDLMRGKSVGIIETDERLGIVKYAKPVGVVAAVTPSTNPAATPVNKAMMVLKGRNAIIISPSPVGWTTTSRTVDFMRAELARIGAPEDLVQILPPPGSKAMTQALMEAADLIVVTGSQDNVRRAYRSGTPAIGVGAGNVPVIIDETADFASAAKKIAASKTFDNATSCSTENSVVIVDEAYDQAIAALRAAGGYMCTPEETKRIEGLLWHDGKLNRHLIARDAAVLAEAFSLPPEAYGASFFMVPETGFGKAHPFSGEKLSLVLAVYRARDIREAADTVRKILDYQGKGHSCGIHTRDMERARHLAETLDVVRVLVNFAHTFGNGGGFDSGLNFTLSMGCGSWQKNSISENSVTSTSSISRTSSVRFLRISHPRQNSLATIGRNMANELQ